MQKISTGKFHSEPPSPSHHSITSSARSRIAVGIVTPSALAALRLTTVSNVVACWTGGLGSPEDVRDIACHQAIGRAETCAVAHQATGRSKFAEGIYGRNGMPGREQNELLAAAREESLAFHEQPADPLFPDNCKRCIKLSIIADIEDAKLPSELLSGGLYDVRLALRTCRIMQQGDLFCRRDQLVLQFQPPFPPQVAHDRHPGPLPIPPVKAGNEAALQSTLGRR